MGWDGWEGGRERDLPRDRIGGWRWLGYLPELGMFEVLDPLDDGVHDSIGNMSWSSYLSRFCT